MSSQKQTFVGLNELMGLSDPKTEQESADMIPVEEPFEAPVVFQEGTAKGDEDQQETDDFNYTRQIIQGIAEKGQELLDIAVKEARNVPHPRNLEVASNVMTQLTKVSKELMSLHKNRQEIKVAKKASEHGILPSKHGTTNVQVNNHHTNVNVAVEGTTSDLLDMVIAAREQAEQNAADREKRLTQEKADVIDAEFNDVDGSSTPSS